MIEGLPIILREETHYGFTYPIGLAVCHRQWEIILTMPVGRCGACGVQPKVVTA